MRRQPFRIYAAVALTVALVTAGCSNSHSGGVTAPNHRAAAVPVVACKTSRGAPATGTPRFGAQLSPGVRGSFDTTQLAYYTDDRRQLTPVLAPRGWQCTILIGADGGSNVTVYPPGGNASGTETVTAQREPACQGCVLGLVCAYIPVAAQQLGMGLPCGEKAIPGGRGQATSHPSRNSYSEQLLIGNSESPPYESGALLYRWKRGQGGVAALETCDLPEQLRSLCQLITVDFQFLNQSAY